MQSYKALVLVLLGILFMVAGCGPEFVVMNSVNEEKALLAIDRIEDQETLKKAAYHGNWSAVRRKAFRKITDQKVLEEIAIRDEFYYLSPPFNVEAAKQITDPNILYRLATHDADVEVGTIAIDKISDQGMLEQLAQNAHHLDVRAVATKRITNTALLERIAINDKYWSVRSEALKKVTSQEVLEKAFYLEKEEGNPRSDIIKRLDNPEILAEVVLSEEEKQGNQDVLRRTQEFYHLCAIGGITDTSVLEAVVHKDESVNVVVFALARLIALEGRLAGNKEKEEKSDSYLAYSHFNSFFANEYRQRIGQLADIIYLLEDPQLAEYWGKPRMMIRPYWSDKDYSLSPFSNPGPFDKRATLQVETIDIEIRFEKEPALHIEISGTPGLQKEEFEIRPSNLHPIKKNYATLSWRYFVREFDRQAKAQNMPSFELKNANRYQELLKANAGED